MHSTSGTAMTVNKRRLQYWCAGLTLALLVVVGLWHTHKPLPEGTSVATPLRVASQVRFLEDRTWVDSEGERRKSQTVFDEVFRLIGQAERLVVLDMFLFNDFAGEADIYRPLSEELTTALLQRVEQVDGLRVVLVTDPFNTLYGGVENPYLQRLEAAGVEVVMTDLTRLRDPNPAWSSIWRLCCQWFGNSPGGWLPNPVGTEAVSLRSYLALLNFKANHRKTVVVDHGADWAALVTSANPHDASSAHSNSGLSFSGEAALDLLRTEAAVAAFSGHDLDVPAPAEPGSGSGAVRAQVLTEAAIRDTVIKVLEAAGPGSRVELAMFYLSHRGIIHALKAAQQRGAGVRVLLDPNKDAFGREKNGVPNRQVALELHRAGVPVRWCNTQGEQCHSKQLLVVAEDGGAELILGSANFTRRNLDDYNLETNVRVLLPGGHDLIHEVSDSFDTAWHNRDGRQSSLDYVAFADESRLRYWQYRLMEATGLSTF